MKKLLIALLIIIGLLLLIAAFMPTTYTISAETIINKPKSLVFDYVKIIKNQENYSVRVMADPKMEKVLTWEDGKVWFIYGWSSTFKNVWVGEQEIKNIVDGDRVDVEIRFKKPFEWINNASTILSSIDENQTKVVSEFYATNAWPTNLMVPLIKKMLQKDMQKNMDNLKAILEK